MANQSGKNAKLTIGSDYAGASLTNVDVVMNGEVIDVTTLDDTWDQNRPGLMDWKVTGTKNVDTEEFIDLLYHKSISTGTSVLVTVFNSAGTSVFKGAGFITHAGTTFPMGAATEDVEITGCRVPTLPA